MIGLGVGGAIIVVALIVLASVLSRIFGDVGGGLGGDELGLNSPSSSSQPSSPAPRQRRETRSRDGVFTRGRGRRT